MTSTKRLRSTLEWLECSRCYGVASIGELRTVCADCGGVLLARYRLDEAARTMSDFDRTIENREKTGVFIGSHVINPINGRRVPLYIGDYVLASYGTGAVMGVPGHDERDFVFARNYGLDYIPVVRPAKVDDEKLQKILEGEFCFIDPGVMLSVTTSAQAISFLATSLPRGLARFRLMPYLFALKAAPKAQRSMPLMPSLNGWEPLRGSGRV